MHQQRAIVFCFSKQMGGISPQLPAVTLTMFVCVYSNVNVCAYVCVKTSVH